MMNKILLLFVLLFNIYFLNGIEEKNKVYYKSEEAVKILNELHSLINKSKSRNKYVVEAINYIKDKIDTEEMYLLVDSEENKNILSGAWFVVPMEQSTIEKPYIQMNINYINLFPYQKSIFFSILIHEIKHAYDYFNNNQLFQISYNNLLEQYLFQMDALYVEALFIDNYLIPNKFELTDFEKEMVKSLKNDNLAVYSFIFEGIDMELVYYIQRLKTDKLTLSEKLRKYIDLGNSLLNVFKYPESGDYEKYCMLVPLYSYTRYIYQIVYDSVYIENKIKPEEFKIEDYSNEIKKICDDMLIILNKYFDDYQSFRSKAISQVDNIYEKAFNGNDLNYEFLIFDKPLIFTHLTTMDIVANKIKKNEPVAKNMMIGNIEKLPDKLSKKNDENINAALKLYDAKKYKQAADILVKAYNDEPENLFVLNYYAKSLYWFDREKSFEIYKKLIDILDEEDYKKNNYIEYKLYNEIDNIDNVKIKTDLLNICKDIDNIISNKIYVNLWFTEAYWKVGTLYLDKEEYLKGAYEITRFLLGGIGNNDPLINEQAMGYLTEAYTFLQKYDLAKYCADKTLKINPKNKYVLYFIDKIKKEYHNE